MEPAVSSPREPKQSPPATAAPEPVLEPPVIVGVPWIARHRQIGVGQAAHVKLAHHDRARFAESFTGVASPTPLVCWRIRAGAPSTSS